MDTDLGSFDRHFAVNARAGWVLIREYARQFSGSRGSGRIVALTSDHTAGNLPFGASKGALDRDAANLVAFLCSPDGGWTNGQLINSDGGL
jgi:3-oxoacyl-[acyl-carrier protein] reductase